MDNVFKCNNCDEFFELNKESILSDYNVSGKCYCPICHMSGIYINNVFDANNFEDYCFYNNIDYKSRENNNEF